MSGLETRALFDLIDRGMIADRERLRRRLRGFERARRAGRARGSSLEAIASDIESSVALVDRRRASCPAPDERPELPISARRDEIKAAIESHQVCVIVGETGSGKTTQLPKLCLELGRGITGMIGHTQPRRIAARTVSARIADELRCGAQVGYKVRFGDRTEDGTLIKLMTDGILLAETQSDRLLERYDTLIIDEAHERSLNVDFLLGYLAEVIDRRADLKVIVTSATIDPDRFRDHFARAGREVPVVEVSGRGYPVELRYDDGEGRDLALTQHVVEVVGGVLGEGQGDVLIFMPGEREIRETATALRRAFAGETALEILPLYARLSIGEQQRVFQAHAGRRIVISTNVAETSLTVPGIRYVIDPGTARISRYSARSRVQGLQIEAISQASAAQRSGRCGRVGPGVCIRLYSESDFGSREEQTPPEIMRSNLASVILRMAALKLGDVEAFPFIDRPDRRLIRDGYETLHELGALDERGRLTERGVELSRLPVDPRVGRMILAGRDEGCLPAVLEVASALSVADPMDRPMDKRDEADAAHEGLRHETSDFLTYRRLWSFYHEQSMKHSRRGLMRVLRSRFISYRRMAEWRDIYRQLREIVRDMGMSLSVRTEEDDAVHRALLTGLLCNIGQSQPEGSEYKSTAGVRFSIFPGSVQFQKRPGWVMAAELVRTTKLYARCVAPINARWIEEVGGHLVSRSYSDPEWDDESGRVMARERVSLQSLELSRGRRVHYGPIEPEESRRLLIHHGLVEGRMRTKSSSVRRNRAMMEELEALEAKTRRRDLIADHQAQYVFYDERVPEGVYSARKFERWCRDAEREDPDVLLMQSEDATLAEPAEVDEQEYPDVVELSGMQLRARYEHDPGSEHDGVTVTVPLEAVGAIRPSDCERLVPGLLSEKIATLIRTLPRAQRRQFDAERVAEELAPGLSDSGSLVQALSEALSARAGVPIDASLFRTEDLPAHLSMKLRVIDARGREVACDRDVSRLRAELTDASRAAFREIAGRGFERDRVDALEDEALPEVIERKRAGVELRAFPAFVPEGDQVALRVFQTRREADEAMRRGLAMLFGRHLRREFKYDVRRVPGIERLRMNYSTLGEPGALERDLERLIAMRLFVDDEGPVRDRQAFESRLDAGWERLSVVADEVIALVGQVLERYQGVCVRLDEAPGTWSAIVSDVRGQLGALFGDEFLTRTPAEWLRHYPRYLLGVERRFERVRSVGLDGDAERQGRVSAWWGAYCARAAVIADEDARRSVLERFRWMIEEYRISQFAQELGTVEPVSEKRLGAVLDQLDGRAGSG